MDSTNTSGNYDVIAAEIEGAMATLSVTAERIAELEKNLRLARGTKEIAPISLAEQVEILLRSKTMSLPELTSATGAERGEIAAVIALARKANMIWNIGPAASPRWLWRLGEACQTKIVREVVHRLITEQPMTTAELVAATGVRAARISGILVDIQRTEPAILDLAGPEDRHRRWFLVPPGAATARLPPKVRR